MVGVSIAWTYPAPRLLRPSPAYRLALARHPADRRRRRTQNLVFTQVSGADSKFKLTAGEMVGKEEEELRLRTVDFEFDYTAKE